MGAIQLRNVKKKFGSEVVIENLNLDIADGSFTVLVGPSGCGKSTTLRMITGLDEPTSGDIYIDGQKINDLTPGKRDIAMVFQNYALYPHMTVYQNMAFGLKVRKTPKEEIDRRVRQAAKILDIAHLLDRKPHALSGGQKQRVAIGSVIVRQPKAYLMDEPLSNLDAKLRSQMRVELSKLHRELGATVIYVTHDQVEAMTLGTRIVVMKSGKIQQAATPGDLYQNPVNKFVAGFIGSPAMNFLPVWVERRDERVCLEFGSSRLYVNRMCASRLIEGGYMGRRVYLGIRPEDFHETGPGENALLFEVEIREMLGAEQLLYGNSGRNELCVRMKPEFKAEPGSTVTVFVDMDRIKLFDMETEDNILYL